MSSSHTTPTLLHLKPLHPQMGKRIPWPRRMSQQSAGFDLAAALDEPLLLKSGERALIACGFAMALPEGYEAQIRPRSGLALQYGISCLNAPGTIDADYRGEIGVLLINHGSAAFEILPGMRIAQMVIAPVTACMVEVVADLPSTQRNEGGFGSTGLGVKISEPS